MGYEGVMGVPITFLYKYNPSQFEIKGILATNELTMLNGKPTYARLLIKKNDSLEPVEFEILCIACGNTYANTPKYILDELKFNPNIKYGGGLGTTIVNGKPKYARILIKKKTITS